MITKTGLTYVMALLAATIGGLAALVVAAQWLPLPLAAVIASAFVSGGISVLAPDRTHREG